MRYDLSTLSLSEIMRIPLPPIPQQKKLIYRPSIEDAIHVYDALNQCIFDNQLTRPTIYLKPRCRKYWGLCYSDGELHDTGSYCEIRLMDKWYCVQWMVTILAHDLAHCLCVSHFSFLQSSIQNL